MLNPGSIVLLNFINVERSAGKQGQGDKKTGGRGEGGKGGRGEGGKGGRRMRGEVKAYLFFVSVTHAIQLYALISLFKAI